MINKLVNGISIAINTEFGNGFEIYEHVTQGLRPPCFLITIVTAGRTRKVAERLYSTTSVDVQYFPGVPGDVAEMQLVSEALFGCLEFISLLNGDLIMGNGMRAEFVDEILHFFIDYNVFLRQEHGDDDDMETLALYEELSDG
jgi:hypothetical protein